MDSFMIGQTEFGIGLKDINIDYDSGLIKSIRLVGDNDIFDQVSNDENGNWSWTLYPPEMYFNNIEYKNESNYVKIIINENILKKSEVALYFMEHNYIEGYLSMQLGKKLEFSGRTNICGEEYSLNIKVNI